MELRQHRAAPSKVLVWALLFLHVNLCVASGPSPAFAASPGGGFGGGGGKSGGFAKKNKKSTGKKTKKSLLSEVGQPTIKPKTGNLLASDEPKLDKWGLPPPTTEDIFPMMPPGTELVSTSSETSDLTLSDIRHSLRDHLELAELENRFDEKCVEKNPLPDRPAMKLNLLHQSPPVLSIENFFTEEECDDIKDIASSAERGGPMECEAGPVQVQSATFSALAQSKRTSTSWFCYYSQVPTLLAKAQKVLGIPTLEQMEEPQIVRYKTGEEFSWHYDEVPSNQLKNGGQRVATLLVYLNDVGTGGGTVFRDLCDGNTGEMLTMKPKRGSALLFFPAYRDGRPDDRTLHKGEIAGDEKWIIQMWTHERSYKAQLPESNFQQSAKEAVEEVCASLGFQ